MGKRLIEGREKSKGKKYSHRPKRFPDQWYCKETGLWVYSKGGVDPNDS